MTEADDISGPVLDASTRSMLEGLASMHTATIACDERGRVCFVNDPKAVFVPVDLDPIGQSIATLDSDALSQAARSAPPTVPIEVECSQAAHAANTKDENSAGDRSFMVRRFDLIDARGKPRRILVCDPNPGIAILTRKNAELESSLRSLSHDLRSPLVSVFGFTRLLQEEFGESIGRTGRHFIERIEQAGHNMRRLLEDTLEFARLDEAQRYPVHVSPTAVLEQVAAEYKLQLDEAGILLRFPEDAPVIVCDRTQLYQLFSNLIGNAIRHAGREAGGEAQKDAGADTDQDTNARRAGRIDVTVEATEGGFEIAVEDDGPGIPAADAERIFRAFETARRSGGPRRSTGLGLAIVEKIVFAHGGRVWVERGDRGGARFVVHLPAN